MAVAFSTDLSTFVPERPIYAVGENSDGSLAWMTNQLMDFQISVDAEEDTKTDANGNTIFSISRAKSCDVSFTTPLLTLELVASMNGSEVERGTNDDKIAVPKFETVKLVATAGKVTIDTTTTTISLAQIVRNSGTVGTPVYKVSAAFLTKDGSTRKKLEKGTTTPASGEFVFTKGSGSADTVTVLNADYDEGSSILITYEYDTADAIQIVNSAEEFPVASVVKVLVRGYDICDKTSPIYAYFIFPAAKFQTNYTLGMALDQNIDCNLTCSYDYCSEARELYRMVVAGE
jgi:hypothetical protein